MMDSWSAFLRACMSHDGAGFEAEKWQEVSRIYRRAMGLALGRKSGKAEVDQQRRSQTAATGAEALEVVSLESLEKSILAACQTGVL